MSSPTWALDPKAKRITVYYEGSSTVREGMPLCYNFDTTTNMTGAGAITATTTATNLTETDTTAEGSQNEGKFIRVEDPAATNLLWFAGVVAGLDHDAETGPLTLDIYVPNGAIVPVRTDLSCTVGRTVLALESASLALTQPLSATQGRSVAIAEETVDRSVTTGIVLARLCPQEFLYQDNTGDALVAAASGTSNIVVNRINVTSAQTSGDFCAFEVIGTSTAGATSSGRGLALYAEANVTGSVANHIAGSGVRLNITGGTPTEYITALEVYLRETGATMTSAGRTSVLSLSMQVADALSPNLLGWIWMAQNGAQDADAFILSSNLAALPAVVFTGDVSLNGQYGIKVYLGNNPDKQWYIPLVNRLTD